MGGEGHDTEIWGSATGEELERATRRVIDRLIALSSELDDDERSVLANLLAPAIGGLLDDDVAGFDADVTTLPRGIADAVLGTGLRITERHVD